MAWSVTLEGVTYTDAMFAGFGYTTYFPQMMNSVANIAANAQTIVNGAAYGNSSRNRIVNGNLAINQRNVAAASTSYAAGVYILDRWKAGPNGVTLSWNSIVGDTTATITAGTLVQVIEGNFYLPEGGSYVLSSFGTAQGRAYQGSPSTSASPAYAATPVQVSNMPAGGNVTVEFSTGTLSLVQYEPGTKRTVFERRDDELRRCQRYYQAGTESWNYYVSGANFTFVAPLVIPDMRTVPSLTYTGTIVYGSNGTADMTAQARNRLQLRLASSSGANTYAANYTWQASAEL